MSFGKELNDRGDKNYYLVDSILADKIKDIFILK